jgi:CubicO group peptidase (beta-lactamase class C family)
MLAILTLLLPARYDNAFAARLQTIVEKQASLWNTSFSLGLNVQGVQYAAAAGFNNRQTGTTVDQWSLYPVGSATKLYTATLALQLQEQGLIDLDAPIYTYVDPFLQRTNQTTLLSLWKGHKQITQITTRQVISMRAGLADYDDDKVQAWTFDPANIGKDLTPLDYLHADDLVPKIFLFAPDKGGAYSSIGFLLAGLALASVTNASTWAELDQKAIFPSQLRAQLSGMTFEGVGACAAIRNVTDQYILQFGGGIVHPWVDISFEDIIQTSCLNGWTFGDLAATPAAAATALYHTFSPNAQPRILSSDSLKQMETFQPLTTGFATGAPYGLGLIEFNMFPTVPGLDPSLTYLIGHPGQDYGSGAPFHDFNPRLDTAIVLAVNAEDGQNCSMPDFSVNGAFTDVAGCFIWDEVLATFANQTRGVLGCAPPGDFAAATAATAAAAAGAEQLRHHPRRRRTRRNPRLAPSANGAPNASAALLRRSSDPPLHCARPAGSCSGASAGLAASDCEAWKTLHASNGGTEWLECSAHFSDPCGCTERVTCSADGAHITGLALGANSLEGEIPGDLAFGWKLPRLTKLDLSANALIGKLPSLPFSKYVDGCDINATYFDCPLPDGAEACKASPSAPPPTCWSGVPPDVSSACLAGTQKVVADKTASAKLGLLAAAIGEAIQYASQSACSTLQATHRCEIPPVWNSSFVKPKLTAAQEAISAVDASAALCLADLSYQTASAYVGGEITLKLDEQTPLVMNGSCTAADRTALLAFRSEPPECARNTGGSGHDCVLSWSGPFDSCATP